MNNRTTRTNTANQIRDGLGVVAAARWRISEGVFGGIFGVQYIWRVGIGLR
jgi:hypothetical protein